MPEDKVDLKEADMASSQAKVESEPLTDEVKVKITGGDDKVDLGTKEGFNGLTKEELMVYAKDPYWVRLRWALFILFWIIWVAMLVASIWIIIQAPKCPSPEPRQWYMKGPVYRVSVPKFKDDLKGLKSEETLNYLVDTGVNSVWLSDFSDGKTVKSNLGTEEEFKELLTAAHDLHLKVIVDVPSAKAEDAKIWLDLGVDGVNLPTGDEQVLQVVRDYIDEKFDEENPQNTVVLLSEFKADATVEKLESLMKNASDNNVSPFVHFPINTGLADVLSSKELDPRAIQEAISGENWPRNAWPNYALSGRAGPRVADRVGVEMADGMNMLLFLLPGTPFTYFGEENAMKDINAKMDWNLNTTSKDKETHYSIYTKLASLRHQESILFGEMNAFNDTDVFGLTRVKRGNPGYLLAINTGNDPVTKDFSKVRSMPDNVRVFLQSIPGEGPAEITKTTSFESKAVTLKGKQSVVFTFVPNFDNKGPKKKKE